MSDAGPVNVIQFYVPLGAGESVDGEVLDRGLPIDEICVVLGIEDGLIDVFTGKRNDRIAAVPETDRQELCAIAICSTDQVRTLVAGSRLVLNDAGAKNVVGIVPGILRTSPASPGSHDQCVSSEKLR